MLRYDKGTSFAFLSLLSGKKKKNRRRGGREQREAGMHMPAQAAAGCSPAPWYPRTHAGQWGSVAWGG